MAVRKTQQREQRLLAEWLAEEVYPTRHRQKVPLGAPPADLVAQIGLQQAIATVRPWRFEVDAIVWDDSELWVVEAKIMKLVDGVAKLPLYAGLVDRTPELAALVGLKRRMILLAPFNPPQLQEIAAIYGVEVVVFHPSWVGPYLGELNNYWTRDSRLKREERLRLREEFGVE